MIAAIVAIVGQALANQGLRMVALKLFLKLLIMTVVPLAIMVGFNAILGALTAYIGSKIDAITPGDGITVLQLTGVASYLYVQMGVSTGLSIFVSALSVKLCLRSIPFVRL